MDDKKLWAKNQVQRPGVFFQYTRMVLHYLYVKEKETEARRN